MSEDDKAPTGYIKWVKMVTGLETVPSMHRTLYVCYWLLILLVSTDRSDIPKSVPGTTVDAEQQNWKWKGHGGIMNRKILRVFLEMGTFSLWQRNLLVVSCLPVCLCNTHTLRMIWRERDRKSSPLGFWALPLRYMKLGWVKSFYVSLVYFLLLQKIFPWRPGSGPLSR